MPPPAATDPYGGRSSSSSSSSSSRADRHVVLSCHTGSHSANTTVHNGVATSSPPGSNDSSRPVTPAASPEPLPPALPPTASNTPGHNTASATATTSNFSSSTTTTTTPASSPSTLLAPPAPLHAPRSPTSSTSSSPGALLAPAPEPLDLARCRHFVNLTNGIEALPLLHDMGLPYSFLRIQSTACEQGNLELLLNELDSGLLLALALGHTCLVYDCGSRGREGIPRAVWYGLTFVRYTLTKLWYKETCPALLRGHNVAHVFEGHIRKLRQSTVKRLRYYTKYIPQNQQQQQQKVGEHASDTGVGIGTGPGAAPGDESSGSAGSGSGAGTRAGGGAAEEPRIKLYGVYRPTEHDTDNAYFVGLLHNYQLPTAAHAFSGCGAAARQGEEGSSSSREGLAAAWGGGPARVAAAADGEALLAAAGWRVFRRGLTAVEWEAQQRDMQREQQEPEQ